MPSRFVTRSLGRAAEHVPGLRQIPIVRLLSIAEVGLIARGHFLRLTPDERRRLLRLIRVARGRPSHLGRRDRVELAVLVAKLEPRLLAGAAVERLSPIPVPRRLVRGPRKR